MAGDGNFGVDDAANQVGALFSALDLHHFRPGFFDEAGRVAYGVIHADVVRAVGHVGHKECMFHAAVDGLGAMEHFFDRYRKRVRVAKHGHGQRVAN